MTAGVSGEAAEYEAILELLYLCPVGILQVRGDGAVEMANPLAIQLLMPIARSPVVDNLFDLLDGYAPEIRNLAGASRTRGAVVENHRIHLGKPARGEVQVICCTLLKIHEERFMVVLSDVSKQVAQERRLKQAESWFSALMSGVNEFAFFGLDADGCVDSWNASGVRQLGYAPDDVLGRSLDIFCLPEEAALGRARDQIDLARRDGWSLEEGWRMTKDGRRFWSQSLASALREDNGEVTGFSVVVRDVTERKVTGQELQRLLTTDHLTGVANRARFFEVAEAEEARWRRYQRPLSALMIDADHFKRVNDDFGHAAGDVVLKALATACQGSLRSIDLIARLGGEEFAILLPSTDLEGACLVAERIRASVENLLVPVDGAAVRFTISVGCAQMGGRLQDVAALLKAADEALYTAKHGGRNQVVGRSLGRAA